MARKPVVVSTTVEHGAISDHEVDAAVAYAKQEYGRDVDHDMVKLMAETTLARREPKTKMPFLAATVVREIIRRQSTERQRELEPKIDALKGAIMKLMSMRSAAKRASIARKRKAGLDVPLVPKQTEHPEDPKREGQFLLFNY
jgi:hypothetical protein